MDDVLPNIAEPAALASAQLPSAPPRALHLNDLQTMEAPALAEISHELDLRIYPGRTRHEQIFDLVRGALDRGATVTAEGFFDPGVDSWPMLRFPRLNFLSVPEDVGIPRGLLQRFKLRPAARISGTVRPPRDREKILMLDRLTAVEGVAPEDWNEPTQFDSLTPLFPEGRIILENTQTRSISARAVDLLTPLGRGQRGLIVAAPRVGKTILLKEIAKSIRVNHPEIVLIILLIDERPEEVTDLQREVDCEIYNSTFDENPRRHVQVAELVLERAKRLVEAKNDVVILLLGRRKGDARRHPDACRMQVGRRTKRCRLDFNVTYHATARGAVNAGHASPMATHRSASDQG